MDFPKKNLQRYSMDSDQRLIHSEDDLGNTNGLLTDRDIIEDSNNAGVKAIGGGSKKRINRTAKYTSKNKKLSRNIAHRMQKQKPRGNSTQKVVSIQTNRLSKNQLKAQLKSSSTQPDLSEETSPNQLEIELSLRRNSPARNGNKVGKTRAILKSVQKLPFFFTQQGQSFQKKLQTLDSLPENSIVQSTQRKNTLRSPEERGRETSVMIEKQLKLLKRPDSRSTQTVAEPNEHDVFFFKDAFEYGARLLARKLARGVQRENVFKEGIFTEVPNEQAIQLQNDLEKIKASVQQNLIRANQKQIVESVRDRNNPLDYRRMEKGHRVFTHIGKLTYAPMTRTIGRSNQPIPSLVIFSSNRVQPNLIDNGQQIFQEPHSTGKLSTEMVRSKEVTFAHTMVNQLQDQKLASTISTSTVLNTKPMFSHHSTKPRLSSKFLKESAPSLPSKNLTADRKKSTNTRQKSIVTRGKFASQNFGFVSRNKVFELPEWKLPPFYYRRPCPNNADVLFRSHNHKVYAIDNNMVYIIGQYGVEVGPMHLQFVWQEVESPINDGYVRQTDRILFLFFGSKYVTYIKDRQIVGEPSDISTLGLPRSMIPIDAVSLWTGNGKTYYFKNSYYWRYNDWENRIDNGYPKRIKDHWGRVPDNIDTAFIAPNSYLYVVKGGFMYKMHFFKASVQYRYPKKLSESCYDFFV